MLKLNMFDNQCSDYQSSPFVIDLQLFNEGGEEAPVESEASYQNIDDVRTQTQEFFNSVMNPVIAESQKGQEQPNNQEETKTEQETEIPEKKEIDTEPEVDSLILGKFKSQDDLVKAYTESEKLITKTRTELAQLKQEIEKKTMQEEQNTAPPSKEEIESQNEEFLNKFYEKPQQTVEEMAEKIAKKMVAPIYEEQERTQKQQEWNRRALEFKESHPDMPEYKDAMVQFLMDNPEIADKDTSIELAYNYVKGAAYQAPKTHDELINDPEFMQKIIENENIRNQILKATAEGVKKGSPPPVISSEVSGGKPVASPPQEAKTFKEAGQMFMKSLGLGGS